MKKIRIIIKILLYPFSFILFYLSYCLRKINNSKKYRLLKQLKNKYKGKRAFIIATGPSLTLDDVEKLKDEYTFAVNSFINEYDKIKWRPSFYCIQDPIYFDLEYDRIKSSMDNSFLFGTPILLHSKKLSRKDKKNMNFYPVYLFNHSIYRSRRNKTKFSDNSYKVVYDGYTITYSCIQLAYYLGFSEVYLIGVDCTYLGTKQHFNDSKMSGKEEDAYRMKYAYEICNKFCLNKSFKVYNATRGGKLETFERVNFDELFEN